MNTVTDVSRESLTAINLIRTLYCKINTKEYTNNIKLCVYKVSFFLNSKSFFKKDAPIHNRLYFRHRIFKRYSLHQTVEEIVL